MTKVLILGASSYVGRHVFRRLGEHRAYGTGKTRLEEGWVYFDPMKMKLADILGSFPETGAALILFAETKIDFCFEHPAESRRLNVNATIEVLRDLKSAAIKPYFMSSEYVFDGSRGSYTEDDTACPNTVYGSQKLEIENFIRANFDDFVIMRLTKAAGTVPGDGTFLSALADDISRHKTVRCATDQIMSPIHIEDLVSVIERLLKMDFSGTVNLTGRESLSRYALATALSHKLQSHPQIQACTLSELPFLDARPLNLSMSSKFMESLTKIVPRSIDACLDEVSVNFRGISL